jgi:hypothetical protein
MQNTTEDKAELSGARGGDVGHPQSRMSVLQSGWCPWHFVILLSLRLSNCVDCRISR